MNEINICNDIGCADINCKKCATKCPKCGSDKYIESIFGSICPDCFYEQEE
jgi:hypothetical protein